MPALIGAVKLATADWEFSRESRMSALVALQVAPHLDCFHALGIKHFTSDSAALVHETKPSGGELCGSY
jgi:hypothetical protein